MFLSLIAAMTPDRVIGKAHGGIPWELPRDKAHFRKYTAGKWLLVGRKTYQEMSGWFADRTPIVMTRDDNFSPEFPEHRVATSASEAMQLAAANGATELVVIGGASVYAAALPLASRLIITLVEANLDGASHFPECQNSGAWKLVHRELWPADAENEFAMTLQVIDRVNG